MEKVLVTGASGFIALHCIQQLLDQGYSVRGTVRNHKKGQEVIEAMRNYSAQPDNLEIVETDLLKDDGWDEAVQGCDYVLHLASPFILEEPDNEDDLIQPAVQGSLRVLKSCTGKSVKKVIMTSSFAAIGYGHDKEIYDEADWSITDCLNIGAYAKSKTYAEKASWDYVAKLSDEEKAKLFGWMDDNSTPYLFAADMGPKSSRGPKDNKDKKISIVEEEENKLGIILPKNKPLVVKKEISKVQIHRLVVYMQTLAPPRQRNVQNKAKKDFGYIITG